MLNWRFDMAQRTGILEANIQWDGGHEMSYERAGLRVAQREIYPPGAVFGSTELLAVRDRSAIRTRPVVAQEVRLSRSYRITETGVIEAREIIKTYGSGNDSSSAAAANDRDRTSTTRSALTLHALSRPLSDAVRRAYAYPDGYKGVVVEELRVR